MTETNSNHLKVTLTPKDVFMTYAAVAIIPMGIWILVSFGVKSNMLPSITYSVGIPMGVIGTGLLLYGMHQTISMILYDNAY